MLEEEDTGSALLGFDLRVFHPTMGEVFHNTNMSEFALMDMKKTLKKTVEADDRAMEETRKMLKDKERQRDDEDDEGEGKDGAGDVDASGHRRTFKARLVWSV